jgi:hypothetical protein
MGHTSPDFGVPFLENARVLARTGDDLWGGRHRQDKPKGPGSDGASPYRAGVLVALRHFADTLCPVLGYGLTRFH